MFNYLHCNNKFSDLLHFFVFKIKFYLNSIEIKFDLKIISFRFLNVEIIHKFKISFNTFIRVYKSFNLTIEGFVYKGKISTFS